MSILEEDGFVLVSKDGLAEGREDDIVSVSSSRSSLCVVDDPLDAEGLFSDDEGQQHGSDKAKSVAEEPGPADEAAQQLASGEGVAGTTTQALEPEVPALEAVPAKQPKFVCSSCSTDVAEKSALVWEGYMGANKTAFLFDNVLNVEAAAEPRKQQLSTGLFLLQDVRCKTCSAAFGWSYLKAWSEDQKYKEGSTIMQKALLRLEHPPQIHSADPE